MTKAGFNCVRRIVNGLLYPQREIIGVTSCIVTRLLTNMQQMLQPAYAIDNQ